MAASFNNPPQPTQSGGLSRAIRRDSSLVLKTSAAETASTTDAGIELGAPKALWLKCDVTAVSGTSPTMTVTIDGSDDNTNWFTIGTFGNGGFVFAGGTATNLTAAATKYAVVPGARYMRYASTVGGTSPSFTYSITGSVLY